MKYRDSRPKFIRNLLSLILGIGFVFFLFSSFSGSQGEVNLEHEIGNDVFVKLGGKHATQKHIPIPDPAKQNSPKPKPIVTDGMKIETRFGDLVFQFHPEAAPKTVAQTKKAVKEGYFDGCHFYRHAKNFVLQGGCWPFPNNKEQLPLLELEYNMPNIQYAVSMGRTSDPNSASSEFAIMLVNNTIINGPRPDSHAWGFSVGYAVFMSLVDGIDVINNITDYGNQFDEWKLDIPFERCTLVP